ncbi:outer membrane protein assembly factor BamA [Marinomonas sp. 15G1-11]|uniref:Outer membrane protein assembly factor BamA n=1 Tax=Marinomonas phaeophyticola TaxID=3004091 RepID=A0ABT4JTR3_9GAMM|nr:outer membrane protein assembly factor BamA [Marinomonas sp. 15G1-11]MCZ2721708.1 outer membrane protein assembly factor BamA [Marinomonas sp. 15G1-11]
MKFFIALFLSVLSTHSLSKNIDDVRVDGLVKMLPAKAFEVIGFQQDQAYNSDQVHQAIKKLFGTGYFSDIDVLEENGVLIFNVVERPSIGELEIEGNDLISLEDLKRGLKSSGLEVGEIYKPDSLNQIEQELQRQYYALGRYSAKVELQVTPMLRNRVKVNVNISEGATAKIVHINLVGNSAFTDEEATRFFESRETGFFNPFSSADEYAKQKIQGDLEKLRSFYLDRGYLDFQLVSSQVSLSIDKKEVYVVINIEEGTPYIIDSVALNGNLILPEEKVLEQIKQKSGDLFSRKEATSTMDRISTLLGDEGYLFTNVNLIPEKLGDHRLKLTYHVTPGPQVYVRRITFSGNNETTDEVLRREITQFEGSLASHTKIQSSKRRLERLGFFGKVDLRTVPVQGTTDQVDLNITVEEQASGSIQASVGYSQESGTVLGFGISKRNFLGTGNKLSFNASRTNQSQDYNLSYDNPYFTVDGVSRGFDLFYQVSDHDNDDVEDYDLDVIGASVRFGYPLTDTQRLSFGLTVKETTVALGSDPSNETLSYTTEHGDAYDDLIANLTWTDNDLIGGVLPTNGYSTKLSFNLALPAGDQQYGKIDLTSQKYWNLDESNLWLFRLKGRAGYGFGYGDSDELPFFENYFAGGSSTVRGFEGSSLGPKNSYPSGSTESSSAIGGNILMAATAEFIFPLPMVEDHKSVRTSIFLDAGNVFTENCYAGNDQCSEGVDFNEIRYSIGINWTWITPIAPLSFNFAQSLNSKTGDSTDFFQFQLGTTF